MMSWSATPFFVQLFTNWHSLFCSAQHSTLLDAFCALIQPLAIHLFQHFMMATSVIKLQNRTEGVIYQAYPTEFRHNLFAFVSLSLSVLTMSLLKVSLWLWCSVSTRLINFEIKFCLFIVRPNCCDNTTVLFNVAIIER